jgi:hypothetical protein
MFSRREEANMIKPSWFKDGKVIVSNALTCGINKDGLEQFVVDVKTGKRSEEIDDKLQKDVQYIREGKRSGSVSEISIKELATSQVYVPQYFDKSSIEEIKNAFKNKKEYELRTLGELAKEGLITLMGGHGSPSSDQRVGNVPYIKVSDLRAGQVNINPSNLIPLELARSFWPKGVSNLRRYDLVSPERASKNIGEFCVLMPGQENVVFTKEVIILRAASSEFDQFYLMWAMSLQHVRSQWNRIILMQTNREDVGDRFNEILIPIPKSKAIANRVSKPFRDYYLGLEKLRNDFSISLRNSGFKHHLIFES